MLEQISNALKYILLSDDKRSNIMTMGISFYALRDGS